MAGPRRKRSFLQLPFARAAPVPTSANLSTTPEALAIALDGSFVETTNAAAAATLARWYSEQGVDGSEYAVTERTDDKGRTVYRIRPRSPPPSPTWIRATSSAPPNRPSFALRGASTKTVRAARSIPPLFSSSKAPAASNSPDLVDSDAGSASSTPKMYRTPTPTLRKVGSTPGLFSSFTSSEKDKMAWTERPPARKASTGSQRDVLGPLLGWSTSSEPQARDTAAGAHSFPSEPSGSRIPGAHDLPDDRTRFSMLCALLTNAVIEHLASESLDPSAAQYLPIPSNSHLPRRAFSDPPPASPFGAGVRLARPLNGGHRLPPSSDGGAETEFVSTRQMREVASSDSMRTARGDDEPSVRPRFEDASIFDVFQSHEPTTSPASSRPSTADDELPETHGRLPTSASVSSSISELSRITAHHITVSLAPGDDPRFVIWGSKVGKDAVAPGLGLRASLAEDLEPSSASPSDRGSPVTVSSKRWSLRDRRSNASGVESSPATSYRDSLASATSSHRPPARLLMAATLERWIAELTSKIESDLLVGFFLTYRSFVSPVDLCHLLIARFTWAMAPTSSPEDEAGRRIVRVRTFVVIRHWLLNHFADDFVPDRLLRTTLVEWLNAAGKEEGFRSSPKDLRLIKGLKKVVSRLKENYLAVGRLELDEVERVQAAALAKRVARSRGEVVSDEETDLEFERRAPAPNRYSTMPSTTTSPVKLPPPSSPRKPLRAAASLSNLRANFSLHSAFPLPGSQSVVSRSVTSALGGFSRFKRMLSSRTLGHPPPASCVNGDAFDGLSFEEGEAADLLYLKGGLERYLEYFNIKPVVGPIEEVEIQLEQPQSLPSDPSQEIPTSAPLSHSQSNQTLRSTIAARLPPSNRDTLFASAYDMLDDPNPFYPRPGSVRLELDDVDLSDEDEDVVEVKRTLKRLPGGSNLRAANTLHQLNATKFRLSAESVLSFGSIREDVHHRLPYESIVAGGDDMTEGVQLVANFVLEGIDDSDDEDAGDVEAALRRLEGQIDEGKELRNAQKVEAQMGKSAQLERRKMSLAHALAQPLEIGDLFTASRPVGMVGVPSIRSSRSNSMVDSPALENSRDLSLDFSLQEASIESVVTSPLPANASIARQPSQLDLPNPRPTSRFVLSPPTHRSFILQYRTEVLAQQFCLIERDMFRVLSWQELVNGEWKERVAQTEVLDWELYLKDRRAADLKARSVGDRTHSDVQAVVARFNLMANWVCSEIVLTRNLDERAALVAKFIRLAFKCYRQSNFQTVTQIVHGLQMPEVERLKKTWTRVPKWEMREFKGLRIFVSQGKNFKYLRLVTNALIDEWGPPGQREASAERRPSAAGKIPIGCIPFLGLFLRDLTTNAALPTFLDPTSPSSPVQLGAEGHLVDVGDPSAFSEMAPLPAHVPLLPLINVHKFRLMSDIVTRVLAFQEFSDAYPYEPESKTYFKCLKLRSLDTLTMHQCSLRLEP